MKELKLRPYEDLINAIEGWTDVCQNDRAQLALNFLKFDDAKPWLKDHVTPDMWELDDYIEYTPKNVERLMKAELKRLTMHCEKIERDDKPHQLDVMRNGQIIYKTMEYLSFFAWVLGDDSEQFSPTNSNVMKRFAKPMLSKIASLSGGDVDNVISFPEPACKSIN